MEEIDLKSAPLRLAEGGLLLANPGGIWSILCDARNTDNMNLLRKLKSRGPEKGFTILIDSDARLNRYVEEVPALAWDILDTADHPLILVLEKGRRLPPEALASDGSIAVRMMHTDVGRSLVRAINGPVACTTLTDTENRPVRHPEDGNPEVLKHINYLLILPSAGNTASPNKPPIIKLKMDNQVEIVRE